MAVGWARDGAVQDQIDASVDDAVARARRLLPKGESLTHCADCGEEFEVLQPIGADGSDLECPSCGAARAEKLLSTFACAGDEGQAVGHSHAGGCSGFT